MSRLDSFIRRVTAQRDCLNALFPEVRRLDGPVIELGLGNGRTYDHLRQNLSERRIVAFDRAFAAHKSSAPPEGDMILGEIAETAQAFRGIGASLVHADIGTGYPDKDALTLTWLPDLAAGLLTPGGLCASGLPLEHAALSRIPAPPSVPEERYFLYRRL